MRIQVNPEKGPSNLDEFCNPADYGDPPGEHKAVDLTILILTLNEEKHILRCIASINSVAHRIVVIDSGSTDRTREIAGLLGADIYINSWVSHAHQLNWALQNTDIQTDWVMRLDADEIVTAELIEVLQRELPNESPSVSGLTVRRQIHFLGRWIKYGGMYPIRVLRLWRNGLGLCEDRLMDEHITVKGSIADLNGDIADVNLNNVSWWIAKHNAYSIREAVELLKAEEPEVRTKENCAVMSREARIKRVIKNSIYAHLPLGFRSTAYFFYRYFIRLGFLDGWQGLAFHVLQGFWYRFLVDVEVAEIRRAMSSRSQRLSEVIENEYGLKI